MSPNRFANDDGSPDEAIRAAHDPATLVQALRLGRVLVAVVAVAEEVEIEAGIAVDKTSDMSVVSMVASDGRRGLLAFTGIDALHAWDPTARPVPVTGIDAAQAALEDGCEALVLDVAGPRTMIVPEIDVVELAGADPLERARRLARDAMTERFGPGGIDVVVIERRLRLSILDEQISTREVTLAIPNRAAALVPDGIEITGPA